MRRLIVLFVLLLLTPSSVLASPPTPTPAPALAQSEDVQRRIDVNNLNMFVTNLGSWANDFANFNNSGLFFPRGTTKTVVYESGLWISARVAGAARATIAEYSQEYGPGPMVGGTFDDPSRPEHRVYKVVRFTGNPADTDHVERSAAAIAADPTLDPIAHHSWSEYMHGAAPYGAPWKYYDLPDGSGGTLQVPGPDVMGDQMLWSVYNDANAARHQNWAGRSAPLGVEVQQTTFAFDRQGALGNTIFMRFRIINKGGQQLDRTFVSLWSDPDLGGAGDDLEGCDTTRSLGYAYNATNNDFIYGATPPAVGVDLLGPGRASAFSYYINGRDPQNAQQTYNLMSGLNADGTPVTNPISGDVTTFYAPGDPVAGTGWLDSNPSDRRMLLSWGPGTLAPGQSMDVWAAVIVGQGADRLTSVAQLRCWDDYAQQVWDLGFPAGLPVGGTCDIPLTLNCPRTPGFYAEQCGGAGALSSAQLQQLGAIVAAQVVSLADASQPGGFCATVADASDVRALAKAELTVLIANVSALPNGITPVGVPPIRLDSGIPATVPGVLGATIADLILPGSTALGLRTTYEVAGGAHPVPLAGVDAGLESFGGGVGYGFSFFGSTLDPSAMPDSFHTVQILFDPAHPHGAHRYLRLEQQSGIAPAGGRGYRYGGYVNVPFVVRDSLTGDTLDVGFVERAVTDAAGSLLPSANQLATFDSIWAPGTDGVGSREYLFLYARPSSGAPRTELAVNGAAIDGTLPWMYALWLRRIPGSAPIGAGDRLTIARTRPQVAGVDSRLLDLAPLSLADPAVASAYSDIASALGAINRGDGIPNSCYGATAALASLVSASAQPGRAEIEWDVAGAPAVQVQRFAPDESWQALGEADVSGSGRVRWQDETVASGARYGYRLALGAGGTAPFAGETWLEIPRTTRLAITGFSPNPGVGSVSLRFSLPGTGRAQVQVLDLAGRRLLARDVTALGPGTHTVPLGTTLAPGIYWLRLTQGSATATTKGILLR